MPFLLVDTIVVENDSADFTVRHGSNYDTQL